MRSLPCGKTANDARCLAVHVSTIPAHSLSHSGLPGGHCTRTQSTYPHRERVSVRSVGVSQGCLATISRERVFVFLIVYNWFPFPKAPEGPKTHDRARPDCSFLLMLQPERFAGKPCLASIKLGPRRSQALRSWNLLWGLGPLNGASHAPGS